MTEIAVDRMRIALAFWLRWPTPFSPFVVRYLCSAQRITMGAC